MKVGGLYFFSLRHFAAVPTYLLTYICFAIVKQIEICFSSDEIEEEARGRMFALGRFIDKEQRNFLDNFTRIRLEHFEQTFLNNFLLT